MKIIVPMAGRGSRLRPHSLTIPKPLIPVAGKPIVHRLVEDIANLLDEPIDEIAFILGDPAWFGDEVVDSLKQLATDLGAKASIYRQLNPLGTGHAIMCAKQSLSGPAVIAYADTLIRADFDLDKEVSNIQNTVDTVKYNKFKRCFEPVPETFRGKETGNTVLNDGCKFCSYRFDCWDKLEERPSVMSKAKVPPMIAYVGDVIAA